jgi:energy-coupling factor transporter ATP-binding protein EcfA2
MTTLKSEEPTKGAQTAPAAHAVDLRKTYGTGQAEVHALAGVSVTFEHGRFTAVMGASGSGKSTLMQCMAGLDRPTSGQCFVGGLDIGSLDDAGLTQLRRDRRRHRDGRRPGLVAETAGHHRHRRARIQPGDLPPDRRPARADRRQLARPPRRQTGHT